MSSFNYAIEAEPDVAIRAEACRSREELMLCAGAHIETILARLPAARAVFP